MPDRPDLGRVRRVHVIGAGGSGMAPIATVLAAMGHHVSGSDAADGPGLRRLEERGVEVHAGHDPRLVEEAEVVVRSTAVPDTNPEVERARELGLTVWRRADVLAAICAEKRTIAVAGTHGKTTTSSMLAVTLHGLGWHPSMIIGGDIAGFGGGAGWDDEGEWFVVEADESDGTFLELGAEAVVVTSVEPDHLEFWGGEEPLRSAFERFVAGAPGPAIVCADDEGARRLIGAGRAVDTYGTADDADYRITDVELSRFSASFAIRAPGRSPGSARVELAVPGLHNVRNAASVLALAHRLGADLEGATAALGAYRGVGRRFEWRGEAAGVSFVDGYDHLPTEVAAAIAAARAGGWERVVTVFQPHRYSRTAALAADFADAFEGADLVLITGIYAAGEAPRPGVTGRLVHDAVAAAHPQADVRYAEDLAAAADAVAAILRPGDLCLTLGAGDITTLPDALQQRLSGRSRSRP